MAFTGKEWLWSILAIGLFFITFRGLAVFLGFYGLAFVSGGLIIIYHYGKDTFDSSSDSRAKMELGCHEGIGKVKAVMQPSTKNKNFDKRMTGANVIDDVLKEVLEFTVRDYIEPWYKRKSDHDGFLRDIWQCAQKVIITFSNRSKEIEWTPYFTQHLVDDFASHIRLYRRACDKSALTKGDKNEQNDTIEDSESPLEDAFFNMEADMEKTLCRDSVCLDPEAERQYLQDLSEVLLFLLLPTEDFHNKPFRYIVREVLVNGIFLPTMDLLSDPDYINQYIAWMCYETSFSRETFLTVIRSAKSIEELEAVRDKVDSDIAKWRSKDTGGSDDTAIKQNLKSLNYLKETCETRIRRLLDGPAPSDQMMEEPENQRNQSLYVLTMDEIFENNIALQSFIEYLSQKGGQQYLYFYLNVEGFRTTAEQMICELQKQLDEVGSSVKPDLEPLRRAAMILYDQYLSEKGSSRIRVETDIIKRTFQSIRDKLSADVFSMVQARVYQILHMQYYEDYLHCPAYIKLLDDIGKLKCDDGDTMSLDEDDVVRSHSESLSSTDDLVDTQLDNTSEDTVSLCSMSSTTSCGSPSGEAFLIAHVTDLAILKDIDKGGKSYAMYCVHVRKREAHSDEENIWDVYRRYSDFDDLRMILSEEFSDLDPPHFPGKTVLKNTSPKFLQKRKKDLDTYLKILMNPANLLNIKGLETLMNKFLQNGEWEKHKSEFSRKMDTIVHPLKNVSKNMGNAVKSVPDGISRVLHSQKNADHAKSKEMMNQMKVGAGLDTDAGENIPLRIMLLLMDEVFDLKHKNTWLRRRIVAILRQLIKATFGDKINRKIVDHVDFMTSSEQMAKYMAAFKTSFWPNGALAEPRPPRDEATKMRTRVLCRSKMLGSVPDEVSTLMGQEAVRLGVSRIFEMFQHKTLNKRILYVILEGVLIQLFPDNKFPALFRKLHSRSKRAEKVKQQQQTAKGSTGFVDKHDSRRH